MEISNLIVNFFLTEWGIFLSECHWVYIGMSGKDGRVKSRLKKHRESKATYWSYFSYYEAWDNISDQEISEMEGLFRQLYRFDRRANRLNKQVTHRALVRVRKATEKVLGLRRLRTGADGIATTK